ncbi:MAG: dephospho-CoA kinase [Gemmatimonadetes bacterium]|nr:dephospho-CoA kinase [Gemmatimonadota bacterium]
MLNVAVTGNAAAGKSTVVKWFREWGATVIDADHLVREVESPSSPILNAIARRFGPHVIKPDGSLDRDELRGRVMGDEDALASLNAIVHPAVRRLRAELVADARKAGVKVLVNEIPLLFEVMNPEDFDLVVLVDAPVATRHGRLVEHRHLEPEDADRLIGSQMPSEFKRERSQIVIDNEGSLTELEARAQDAWRSITERAGRTLDTPGSGG